jgi:hypothetical protein
MNTEYMETVDYFELATSYARAAKHRRNAARTALRNELAMLFMNETASASSLSLLNSRVRELERAVEEDTAAQLICNEVRHALETAAVVKSENVAAAATNDPKHRMIGFVPPRSLGNDRE